MNRVFTGFPIKRLIIGLLTVSTLILVVIGYRLCTVTTVRIYGTPQVLGNTSALETTMWLPILDSAALVQQLITDNPLAKDITIAKHYPNTLELTVHQRAAAAAVKSDTGYFIVDETGVIIAHNPDTASLPVITTDQLTVNADQIEESIVRKSIQIVSNSVRNGFIVRTISISSPDQLITIAFDGGTILFPGNKNVDYLFSSLQLLLPQFRIEGKQSVVLDFRFDKPIIR